MGVLSVLKSALSGVNKANQFLTYGPDYKQKLEAMKRLNMLKDQGAVLDVEEQMQRIAQSRAQEARLGAQESRFAGQAARDAFTAAANAGSMMEPEVNSVEGVTPGMGGMGPMPSVDVGMGTPDLSALRKEFGSNADPKALQSAADFIRKQRDEKARREEALFGATLQGKKALATNADARTFRTMNPVPRSSGSGGRSDSQFAKDKIILENGETVTRTYGRSRNDYTDIPWPTGSRSPNSGLTAGAQDTVAGAATTVANIRHTVNLLKEAQADALLGPAIGRITSLDAKYLAGTLTGMTTKQRLLAQSIDRAAIMAAFGEGGKTLTGNEKEFFEQQFPHLQNARTTEEFIALSVALAEGIEERGRLRNNAAPIDHRIPESDWKVMFNQPSRPSVFQTPPPATKVPGKDILGYYQGLKKGGTP